jgi:hypothetical protein
VADEMRALDLEVVHHRHKIIRHLIDGIADARAGAVAGATMIVHNRPVARGEGRNVRRPIAAGAAEPGDQQHRRTAAVRFVVDFPRRDGRHGRSSPIEKVAVFFCARR